MALVKCKECGHEVSDKASTCPNCGCPIEKGLVCKECGCPISATDAICPNCGCPIKRSKIGFGWKKPMFAFFALLVIVGGAYAVLGASDGTTKDIQITQELAKAVHRYSEIDNFHEGLAGVRKDMWGFINANGEEVIACQYERIQDFSEGLACVRKDGKWGYIDKKGNVVIPFNYIAAGSFSEGMACFYLEEPTHPLGFIDKVGNVVIPAKYFGEYESEELFSIPSFKNGVCRVFSENISVYSDDSKVLIIDKKGNVIGKKVLEDNDTEKSLYEAFEKNGKYGIQDSLNNIIVPARYSNIIGDFSEGLAAVYLYGENTICGFVDKKGNDTFTKEDWEKLSQYEQSTLQAEAKRIEDELLNEEEARRIAAMKPQWLYGTWVADEYGYQIEMIVSENNLIQRIGGQTFYNGAYYYDGNDMLLYNQTTDGGWKDVWTVDKNQQALMSNGIPMRKINGSYGNSSYSNSSANSRIQRLERKAQDDINELNTMVSSGRMNPATLMYIKQNLPNELFELMDYYRSQGNSSKYEDYAYKRRVVLQVLREIGI